MGKKLSHQFVEEYDGLIGFGFSREVDEYTLTYYIQRFADDELMALIRKRMADEDIDALSAMLMRLMRKYLTDKEYHAYFFKGEEE